MIHKTTRSILSVLLAALLLVTSTPLTPAFAGEGGAVSLQSESAEGRALTGSGAPTDPYRIATAEELWEFAELVNGGDTDANAILTANIDLNNRPWYPIGNEVHLYTGTFNGDGHTISGLYIDFNADYQGLFGYVGTGGTVKDLSVSGTVSGKMYVGGIAGQNNGTVENCYNTGSVTNSVGSVGGVVGDNRGTVENCYNTGSVTSSDSLVGGVVGWNSGIVTNCYNTGTVSSTSNTAGDGGVGGVVGVRPAWVTTRW